MAACLEIEEHSHADLANAYVAGASGLPFAVLRAYAGSDLPKVNPLIKTVTCPFTGEVLAAVPSVRPDVTVIHAQKADRKATCCCGAFSGCRKKPPWRPSAASSPSKKSSTTSTHR
jgi:glutaconate CoA-transferase subunit A